MEADCTVSVLHEDASQEDGWSCVRLESYCGQLVSLRKLAKAEIAAKWGNNASLTTRSPCKYANLYKKKTPENAQLTTTIGGLARGGRFPALE